MFQEWIQYIKQGNIQAAVDALNKFIESLQPQSPQIQLIASQLGIDIEFFRYVKYEEFYDPDPKIQLLRYKYYAYKVQKWGQQIMEKRKHIRRRNDVNQQYQITNDSENPLQDIQDKDNQERKSSQINISPGVTIRKKTEYIRKAIQTEYNNRINPIKVHLQKVKEVQQQNQLKTKQQIQELINKRQQQLNNAHDFDQKIESINKLKLEKIEMQKRVREEKKQRQHSLKESVDKEYDQKIQREFMTLEERDRNVALRMNSQIKRVTTTQSRINSNDSFDEKLIEFIKKNEQKQPVLTNLMGQSINKLLNKKQISLDKIHKIKQNKNQSFFQTATSYRNQQPEVAQEKKQKIIQCSLQVKREEYKQKIQNFNLNQSQLEKQKVFQVQKLNDHYSRQQERIKAIKESNQQLKQQINQAIIYASKQEEQNNKMMSRAIHLISDPDLQLPIPPTTPAEKLSINQKIAKKKQEEMQNLLKSFDYKEPLFQKSLTEANLKEGEVQL
ncbi:hypothetical protein pb186bvf_011464 [Paramecium bursaria]